MWVVMITCSEWKSPRTYGPFSTTGEAHIFINSWNAEADRSLGVGGIDAPMFESVIVCRLADPRDLHKDIYDAAMRMMQKDPALAETP
jgi:hypothetical protein